CAMREIDGSCIHWVTIGVKPFATRRRSRSFVPLFRQTARNPKFALIHGSTFCGPIPESTLAPRSGIRASSCETSMPRLDSAITTEAGPQLFSDCHTCFMSIDTLAGADLGSGPGSTAGAATKDV